MKRLRSIVYVLLVLMMGVVLIPPQSASADTVSGEPILFAETGHTLGYNFRIFFESQGGLDIFGYPISEVFMENGIPVQYFERARLEWHAPIARVQAGHLGRWMAREKADHPAFQPLIASPNSEAFFAETGHSLNGAFYDFWQANGGMENFGAPLSEPYEEVNPQNGQTYVVQYFERAVFELHTNSAGEQQVMLGHLGRQYLAANPAPAWAMQPVASADVAWAAVRPTHIRVPRIGVDVGISMTGFSFGQWEVPRWTAAHYWPVAGVPNSPGNIVLAGHVGYPDIIFSYLPQVEVGDDVYLAANGGERHYVVDEVLMLLPHDTWVMQPTEEEVLTIITCYPVGVYSHRLVVRATPAEVQ